MNEGAEERQGMPIERSESSRLYERLLRGEVSSRAYIGQLRREARERVWSVTNWRKRR